MKTTLETVIGLEVHAQLRSRTKLFCGCENTSSAAPNSRTCPVCLGLPGALPVLNERAVQLGVRVGLALQAQIARLSTFARKNYFYPDVPKNYQITQYEQPLCRDGHLRIEVGDQARRIRIARIHLEEDAGKLLHDQTATGRTRVDLNRAGVPLLEIVSAPELRSGEEAYHYLRRLRQILVYLEASDGNLEEGSLRCDANISLRPQASRELGTKIELKNLNSFRGIWKALDHEASRQAQLLARGEELIPETRSWNAAAGRTEYLRGKEHEPDYRYFPEPDLPPLRLSEEEITVAAAALPELPEVRQKRLQEQYGLPAYDAGLLTETPQLADYFEATAAHLPQPKQASNWIMTEVLQALSGRSDNIRKFRVSPELTAELLQLVGEGTLSGRMAKEVFAEMIHTGQSAASIVAQRGWQQTSDPQLIHAAASEVLAAHPQEVRDYLAGKQKILDYFVGQVMAATKGRANPQLAGEILRALLAESSDHP